MTLIKQALLGLWTGLIGTTIFSQPAASIDFSFSFENALNGGGTVTGVIRGLEEGTGPADSVEVLSNTAGFGIGEFAEFAGNPDPNSWTVVDGDIVAFDFFSFGSNNITPAVTNSSLFFDSFKNSDVPFSAGLTPSKNSVLVLAPDVSTEDIGLSFTKLEDPREPFSSPNSIFNSTGLMNPDQTIRFDEFVIPFTEFVTDQYASLGVDFSPGLTYSFISNPNITNIDSSHISNFTLTSGTRPSPIPINPFSIQFREDKVAAAFSFISSEPTVGTFTALLDGAVVETFRAPTAIDLPESFYGFKDIVFDEIKVDLLDAGPAGLDNLQTVNAEEKSVPEPVSILSLLAFGAIAIRKISKRKQPA